MLLRASWQRFGRLGAGLMGLSIFVLSAGCSSERNRPEDVGRAQVELTNAPKDVKCLRLTVNGPQRTDVRKFPLTPGQRSVFQLDGLPVGNDTFTAHAFAASCSSLNDGASPTWYSDPVVANISAGILTHVAISMIHNGRVTVGIDFGDGNGPEGQRATSGRWRPQQPRSLPQPTRLPGEAGGHPVGRRQPEQETRRHSLPLGRSP